MKNVFKLNQKAWDKFLKPTVNTLAPVIVMAVGTKSRYTQDGQATNRNLKNISGGKILSSTDIHGHFLRLNVMCYYFIGSFILKRKN